MKKEKITTNNKIWKYNVGAGPVSAQTNNRGITLIVLVITIIVLLILAGITINLTIGQDGIIRRAQEAGINYQNAAEYEQTIIEEFTNQAENIISGLGENTTQKTYTLEEMSWEEIARVAKAISDNDETITNDTEEVNITVDGKNYTVAVGDIATVDGKKVRVLGFNHDKLSDTSAYGGENTYAGISFEYVDFITSNSSMNSSNTNSGGWGACELRTTLNGSLYNSIKNIVNIKQVEKAYCATYNSATLSYSDDYLWLLSCAEIWDNGYSTGKYGYSMGTEGAQYKYYKNIDATYNSANNALKKPSSVAGTSSSGTIWWLRSSRYDYSNGFCIVTMGGSCGGDYASYSYGVAPGFAI